MKHERGLHVAISTFMFALALAACVPGGPVALTINSSPGGCFLSFTVGTLVVDPAAGVAIAQEGVDKSTIAVAWPKGFTGRKSGDQVEVLNSKGDVVAKTGERYKLLGGVDVNGHWEACASGILPPT